MPLKIQKLLTLSAWLTLALAMLIFAPLSSSPMVSQSAAAAVADDAVDTPGADKVFKQLEDLLHAFYPKAKVTKTDNSMHFEYKLKTETGFYSNKPALAPQDGGILGDLSVQPGEYAGADKARLPSELPDGFHTNLKMAPYSSANKDHLLAVLTFPSDASEEFKEKFKEIVNSFAPKQQITAATSAPSGGAAPETTQAPPQVAVATPGAPAAVAPPQSAAVSAAAPPPTTASRPVANTAVASSQPQGLHLFGPTGAAATRPVTEAGSAGGPPSFTKYGITLGGPARGGRLIAAVNENSIASEWGMQAGDVVILSKKPNYASLKAQRAGSTYEVNLTLTKAQFASMKHMVGRFLGTCTLPNIAVSQGTSSITTSSMETTFALSANGGLRGSYSEGTGCTGYLDGCKLISDHKVFFIWHDSEGRGQLTISFNSDYSAFGGEWNMLESTETNELVNWVGTQHTWLQWSGRRAR
jgi:hypothetical protein